MRTKIGKWGNSVAVRIPRSTLEAAGLREGQEVDIAVRAGVVELRSPRKRYTIEELFDEARKKGPLVPPPSVDWGPDRGAEIIEEDAYSRGEITLEDLMKDKDGPQGG